MDGQASTPTPADTAAAKETLASDIRLILKISRDNSNVISNLTNTLTNLSAALTKFEAALPADGTTAAPTAANTNVDFPPVLNALTDIKSQIEALAATNTQMAENVIQILADVAEDDAADETPTP